MATTTGAVVARNLKLELSANGTTWTDISGHSNKIELSGGERDTGSMPVFGNNSPIVTSGDKNIHRLYRSANRGLHDGKNRLRGWR